MCIDADEAFLQYCTDHLLACLGSQCAGAPELTEEPACSVITDKYLDYT